MILNGNKWTRALNSIQKYSIQDIRQLSIHLDKHLQPLGCEQDLFQSFKLLPNEVIISHNLDIISNLILRQFQDAMASFVPSMQYVSRDDLVFNITRSTQFNQLHQISASLSSYTDVEFNRCKVTLALPKSKVYPNCNIISECLLDAQSDIVDRKYISSEKLLYTCYVIFQIKKAIYENLYLNIEFQSDKPDSSAITISKYNLLAFTQLLLDRVYSATLYYSHLSEVRFLPGLNSGSWKLENTNLKLHHNQSLVWNTILKEIDTFNPLSVVTEEPVQYCNPYLFQVSHEHIADYNILFMAATLFRTNCFKNLINLAYQVDNFFFPISLYDLDKKIRTECLIKIQNIYAILNNASSPLELQPDCFLSHYDLMNAELTNEHSLNPYMSPNLEAELLSCRGALYKNSTRLVNAILLTAKHLDNVEAHSALDEKAKGIVSFVSINYQDIMDNAYNFIIEDYSRVQQGNYIFHITRDELLAMLFNLSQDILKHMFYLKIDYNKIQNMPNIQQNIKRIDDKLTFQSIRSTSSQVNNIPEDNFNISDYHTLKTRPVSTMHIDLGPDTVSNKLFYILGILTSLCLFYILILWNRKANQKSTMPAEKSKNKYTILPT